MRNPTVIGAGAYGGGGGDVVVNPYPTYTLVPRSVDVVEGSPVTFTVTRADALGLAAGVDWAVVSGIPADFGGSLPSGHAAFGVGATASDVSLPTSGNTVVDATRSFVVRLSNPGGGGLLGTPSSLAGTIADDDSTDPWALYPAWPTVAVAHVESGAPATTAPTQTAAGVTIREEATGTTGAFLELFWKKSFPATHDFTFATEYVRTAMPGTSRTFALFWDVVGDGTTGFPASVPDWTALVFAQFAHATGTYLIIDQGGAGAQLFGFDKAASVQIGASFVLTVTQGVRYGIVVQRRGTTVTLTVTDTTAGTSVTNSWTDPKVQRGTADGYFGLRTRGELCTVENNTLTDDGATVAHPAGFATAPKASRILSWELAKRSDKTAAVTEGSGETVGVRLTAGPKDLGDANDGLGTIALVSLTRVAPPGTLKFDYQPLSTWAAETPNTPNGVFSIVAFHALNSGGGDLSTLGALAAGEWTANYSPVDDYYSNGGVSPARAVGGRLSIDTNAFGGGGGANKIRWRFLLADGTIPGAIGGVQTFDFRTPGGWSTVAVLPDPANNQLTVTVTFSDGTVATETMTDARFSSVFGTTQRNAVIGAYNGRDIQVRNVSWTPGNGNGNGGGTGTGWYSDPALGTKTPRGCATLADLNTAKANFQAGTWKTSTDYVKITAFLAIGNYTFDWNVGTQANPLVVTCDIPADKTSFAGRNGFHNGTVSVGGWEWLHGLRIVQDYGRPDACVHLVRDYALVTRCQIDGSRGIAAGKPLTGARSMHHWLGYNQFTGCPVILHLNGPSDVESDRAQIMLRCGSTVADNPDFTYVYRNYFTQNRDCDPTNQGETISLYSGNGLSNGQRNNPYDVNLHHSVIEGNYVATHRKHAMYFKHCLTIRRNHVKKLAIWNSESSRTNNGHNIFFRGMNAINGRIYTNRCEAGESLGFQGYNHHIVNNVCLSNCFIQSFCHCDNPNDPKTLLGSDGARIVGNNGKLVLGDQRSDPGFSIYQNEATANLKDVQVLAHTGAVVDDNGATILWTGLSPKAGVNYQYIEESSVTKDDTARTAWNGYDLTEVPPTLNSTICGPSGTDGLTWDGTAVEPTA